MRVFLYLASINRQIKLLRVKTVKYLGQKKNRKIQIWFCTFALTYLNEPDLVIAQERDVDRPEGHAVKQ